MSDPDDPFGRRDRTIISPNPGGRRAPPPGGGQPPQPPGHAPPAGEPGFAPPPGQPPGYAPPSGQPPTYAPPPQSPAAWPQQPPPGYAPQPAGWSHQPPAPGGWTPSPPPGADAWGTPGAARSPYQTPPPAAPMMPPPSGVAPGRIDLYAANRNILLQAAAPLLLLLARLRTSLSRGAYASLMDQVAQSIVRYESDLRQAGVPEPTATIARYAVAATADDIVQNIPSEERHLWAQYSMLARFFGDRTGGVRFFSELDRLRANPVGNEDLLELMHACLALGFEGVHRTSAGGAAILQGIQRDLYEALRRVRPRGADEISPHWRGREIPVERKRSLVPPWAVAALSGVILLATFLTLRTILAGDAEAVAASMKSLHPGSEVAILRDAVVTPPPPAVAPPDAATQLQRIRGRLSDEIADGTLSVDQTANVIVVRVGNLALFDSGKASVKAAFEPIAARIGETLEAEPGAIRVIGHTDNVPIRSAAFPSNFVLSEERAKSVAGLIANGLTDPSRVVVEGKGADQPIASNDTAEGRAANRRVEIVIPRAD